MAFNRSGRSRVIRVTPSSWLVDLQCVHGVIPPLGSAISCNTRHGSVGRCAAAGDGSRTWVCSTRASSTLRWPRSSPGTSGRERCCAFCRRGSRSRSRRRRRPWSTGRRSCGCPERVRWVAQHSEDDPPHRFVDELVSLPLHWRHTHTFEAIGGARHQGHRPSRDARPGLVPPPDLPLPASPTRRRPGRAPSAATRADASDGRRHGFLGPHRLGPVCLPLDRWAPCHPPGAARAHGIRRSESGNPERPDPRRARGRRRGRPSGRVRPSPAASPTAHKRRVRDSRVGPTAALAACHGRAARWAAPAGVRVGDRLLRDRSRRRGADARTAAAGRVSWRELVEDWEAAAEPARAAGVRVVHVRTGIVQSARGASLKLLRPLFAAGLGGPLAPGSQWVSWIGLDDLLDVFGRALADDTLAGPLNAVSPLPRHQP